MMKMKLLLGVLISTSIVWSQTTENRLQQLEDKVAKLSESDGGSSGDFKVYYKKGFRLESADKAIQLRLGGRIMNDWALTDADDTVIGAVGDDLDGGTEFRRVRFYMKGLLYNAVKFKMQFNFGDSGVEYKDMYVGMDGTSIGNIEVGRTKEPFSLDELTSSKYGTFMERGLPNLFAPGRNSGVKVSDTVADERMTWAVGAFKATDDYGASEIDGDASVTARVTGLPMYTDKGKQLVHLGLAYSYRNPMNEAIRYRARPEVHISERFVNTGTLAAEDVSLYGAEAAAVYGPFSLQSEYVQSVVENDTEALDFSSFYAQASVFLTGEYRKYDGESGEFGRVSPKSNFLLGGSGFGALELAARYSYVDLDDGSVNGGQLEDTTLGLNWYLNPQARVMLNYVHSNLQDVGDTDTAMVRFQVDF